MAFGFRSESEIGSPESHSVADGGKEQYKIKRMGKLLLIRDQKDRGLRNRGIKKRKKNREKEGIRTKSNLIHSFI